MRSLPVLPIPLVLLPELWALSKFEFLQQELILFHAMYLAYGAYVAFSLYLTYVLT